MIKDDSVKVLNILAKEIVQFYLSKSCPCGFPRYRFLVGFDGGKYSDALLHTFDTNVFALISIDKDTGFLVENQNGEFTCRICNSTYQYIYDEYSINFAKVRLVSKTINQKDIGALSEIPFALFAGLYLTNGTWEEYQIKTELERLSKEFPIVSQDEFKIEMEKLLS